MVTQPFCNPAPGFEIDGRAHGGLRRFSVDGIAIPAESRRFRNPLQGSNSGGDDYVAKRFHYLEQGRVSQRRRSGVVLQVRDAIFGSAGRDGVAG